jgi:hypothetical protein
MEKTTRFAGIIILQFALATALSPAWSATTPGPGTSPKVTADYLDAVNTRYDYAEKLVEFQSKLQAATEDVSALTFLHNQQQKLFERKASSKEDYLKMRSRLDVGLALVSEMRGRTLEMQAQIEINDMRAKMYGHLNPDLTSLARLYATLWKSRAEAANGALSRVRAESDFKAFLYRNTRKLHARGVSSDTDLVLAKRQARAGEIEVEFWQSEIKNSECHMQAFEKIAMRGLQFDPDLAEAAPCRG